MMRRRAFLDAGCRTAAYAMVGRRARTEWVRFTPQAQSRAEPMSSRVEDRVARVLEAFDAQGNHRTGTDVDNRSAEWLAAEMRGLGVAPALEPFTLNRIDPQECHLAVAGRRIDSVPMFDAGFTDANGVRGRLGPLGSDAEIALVGSGRRTAGDTAYRAQNEVERARRSGHKAVVVVTHDVRPGLFLLNANEFLRPAGPPMLQVSSAEDDWLRGRAAAHEEATLVARVNRTTAQALNVTAEVAGTDPELAPLVFMAPRSGWWQCASEQGSRLVCWLETMRTLAAGRPRRRSLFVAMSGHELGFLGIDPYITRRPNLVEQAHAWIFFGSDIGAPQQPNLLHASDDQLERWAVSTLATQGLNADATTRHDAEARGETAVIQRGRGRFFTIACESRVFHNVADRWPEAIDVAQLGRYARALADGALQLAQSTD
jgi:hypothetical protein